MDSNLHPNWRALSTVPFKFKIFKKATESDEIQEKIEKCKSQEIQWKDGQEVVNVYKEILEMPSTSREKKAQIKEKKPKKSTRQNVKFDQNLLFKAAQKNNIEVIQSMFDSNQNFPINCVDYYGWTPLMVAACEGSLDSFIKLLELGADLFIGDKQGKTAKKLAQQKNHQHILEAIQRYETLNEDCEEVSDEEDASVTPHYCKLCKVEFIETSTKDHENSTLHLYNYKSQVSTNIKAFGIPRSNKGYKMMKRLGWDAQSGLGQEGRKGQLYPVKTTLRKGRSGLGIEQSAPKISHFGPNDPSAIKYREQERAPSRKQILKSYMDDKKLTRKLRDELS